MTPRQFLVTIALILAALWGGFLGYVHVDGNSGFLNRMEASLTDIRSTLIGARRPPRVVSIIAIDDRTAATNGYPLPRATLARLVRTIGALKPKVVALDLLLVDPGPEDGDAALVSALREVPSVIAAAGVFPESAQSVTRDSNDPLAAIPVASEVLLPLARFADAAAIGVVNVATDQTGTPRFIPMISRGEKRVDASFPLRAASLALGIQPVFSPGGLALGDHRLPTDGGQRLPLTFYGPRGTISTYSAADVLSGKLPTSAVEDKVVVIGSTVTGGGDVFPTPFDPVLPGVEVMSTAIAHLVAGDSIVRDYNIRSFDALTAIVLPVVLIALLAWRRSVVGYGTMATIVLVWAGLNMAAFAHGYWFSAALPIAAALPAVILFGAYELWNDRRQATRLAAQSDLLQRVDAAGLGEWLARDPDFLAKPVRQDASVVFIDLSGFTGLSEAIGVSEVREILSGFFELFSGEARSHGGTITSFMGDGAMILFGLPKPGEEDAASAVACAVGLCDRMRKWVPEQPRLAERRVGFKVGAHCGPVVASRLGTAARQQITATGDTVNVASRLMEVAAAHGAELALSSALLQASGEAGAGTISGGILEGPEITRIRGRAESIEVRFWRGHPL